MTEFNSYPVFVADQVLMANHLNEIVNYLDEQERFTRNKLIGIGIACGLELKTTNSQISITTGCGVTSAGYLMVQKELNLSHYREYEVPPDLFSKYKSIYEDWNMWELLTTEEADAKSIDANRRFMADKIVVLLLEMKETLLKNCVDTNCDNKGEKKEFIIKPLLVLRADIDAFLKQQEGEARENEPRGVPEPVLQTIDLPRFNVPVSDLTSSDVILNAFLQIVNEPLLKRVSAALNNCYVYYQRILFEEPTNPFTNLFQLLKDRLTLIKDSNPSFLQYFYDWIDDIIKAYHEFKEKIFDVHLLCCPADDLFPLHLMLGESNRITSIDFKSKYRHYFRFSMLFNQQKELLAEVQLLFRRMKLIIQNYVIPNPRTFENVPIKITPSKYLDHPLSDRCIPYYYSPSGLYQSWSWKKTRQGNARNNLSYNATEYNDADPILNPLLYDIEPFNFFRVEGHIGKNYTLALSTIITQRTQFNLPFEVAALSSAMVARYVAADDKECLFKDLESLYQVIIAELICKFGDLACMITDVPYQSRFPGRPIVDFADVSEMHTHLRANINPTITSRDPNAFINSNLLADILAVANISLPEVPVYKKGDFIRKHCSIKKGTVGEIYLFLIERGHSFIKPVQTTNQNVFWIYAHLLYFLDCVENVMGGSWPYTLKNYSPSIFNPAFTALTEESRLVADNIPSILEVGKDLPLQDLLKRFPGLIHTCFHERLQALKNEYLKRHGEVLALTNFMNYFKRHPGLEHKAGAPKGGTFVIVYHETPRKRFPFRPDFVTDSAVDTRERLDLNETIFGEASVRGIMDEAAVKDPTLLKNFRLALTRYLDICRDMDNDVRDDINDIITEIPEILAPTKFRIPQFAVIADFYTPYLCCSDCPPITFVVPKTPETILSLGIIPTEFCNNDENSYNVSVSPLGGALTASGGGVEQGTFVFKPKGLAAGVNTLKYTLPDGRSTTLDIKITAAIKVDFKSVVQRDGITVAFTLSNTTLENVLWDFGDRSRSTELAPSHTYQFDEEVREFVVKLTVKDGPCFSAIEHTVKLTRPVRTEFNIIPLLFCSRDQASYDFTTIPITKSVRDIKNENKLIIARDASTGLVSFSPGAQNTVATQEYNLGYKDKELTIRIVVPNADFTMRLFTRQDPAASEGIILHIDATNANADQYLWTLTQPRRKLNFSQKTVDVSYKNAQINPESSLQIILRTSNDVPGVVCQDQKEFTLTPELFGRFLDKNEFDNNTTV